VREQICAHNGQDAAVAFKCGSGRRRAMGSPPKETREGLSTPLFLSFSCSTGFAVGRYPQNATSAIERVRSRRKDGKMAATGNEENKARNEDDLKQTENCSNRVRYDFDDAMMRRIIIIHPSIHNRIFLKIQIKGMQANRLISNLLKRMDF
jgi:hypothetical protein